MTTPPKPLAVRIDYHRNKVRIINVQSDLSDQIFFRLKNILTETNYVNFSLREKMEFFLAFQVYKKIHMSNLLLCRNLLLTIPEAVILQSILMKTADVFQFAELAGLLHQKLT